MNDLKSDLFPSLDCLRGDVAPKGEESGRRGRVHLGGRLLSSLARTPGRCVSALLITHHAWMVYFIYERK